VPTSACQPRLADFGVFCLKNRDVRQMTLRRAFSLSRGGTEARIKELIIWYFRAIISAKGTSRAVDNLANQKAVQP
jgi:hypothetical protein